MTGTTAPRRGRRAWLHAVRDYVASAPLTYSWLLVLAISTGVQHLLPARVVRDAMREGSTNLRHLASAPVRVLAESLLWVDGRWWWPYLIVFSVFLAPAERWLGKVRWVLIGVGAHVTATYLSEGYLYWRIQESLSSPRLLDARDIGVSYATLGLIGVLTYRIPPGRRRWCFLAVPVIGLGLAYAHRPDFTSVGHICAFLVGLACYPAVRRRATGPAGESEPAASPVAAP